MDHLPTATIYFNPNGCNTLSRATLAAMGPPLCSATAPTILYNVWTRTVSSPLPFISSDLRGFHLITPLMPYVRANLANLDFSRAVSLANGDMFSTFSSAGC